MSIVNSVTNFATTNWKPLAIAGAAAAGGGILLNEMQDNEKILGGLQKYSFYGAAVAGAAIGASALMRRGGNFGNLQAQLGALGTFALPYAIGATAGFTVAKTLHDKVG